MLTMANTLAEALEAVGEYRAGGTDLQERRRSGTASGPIVDISRLSDYRQIDDDGATIGALVSIDALANDSRIRQRYRGIALAAGGLATPQIRSASTLGGALLQRTRCAYFRHPAFHCFKSGGDSCPARHGQNHNGVVFDLGPCVYPHPATLGMALLAYEAEVEVNGEQRMSIEALYGDGSDPTRDHMLVGNQLLTRVFLGQAVADEQTAYFRAISRAEAEWPIVEALVRLQLDSHGNISFARVAVGGVANIPLRLHAVEQLLEGRTTDHESIVAAAEQALVGANPLPQTGYKLKILRGTLIETMQQALASD